MHPTVILLNKPYGVLSQFTQEGAWQTLSAFGPFPPDVYAAGRLDAESEGLLLLTNDAGISHRLTEPKFAHPRTYWAQVEGLPDDSALVRLRSGIDISGYRTLPAEVRRILDDPELPTRTVPIRFRKNIPTSWLELTLTEGKNRQVRRMTAAVGHPCLRLVRVGMVGFTLSGLSPGKHRVLTPGEVTKLKAQLGDPADDNDQSSSS